MPKANDTDIYGFDEYPSLLDYLFGTDASDNKKNKSYRLNSIIQLINGVNGKNNLQFIFSNGSNVDATYYNKGLFFTDNNEVTPGGFTKLILNKESLQPIDLTELFTLLSTLENVVIKLENPINPNNVFNFIVTNITDEDGFFVFDVVVYNGFVSGSLINEAIYSLYFDVRPSVSSEDNNKIITETGFAFSGSDLIVNANWSWKLFGIIYSNPLNVTIPIPYCASGKSRIDYIVPNTDNGFTRISGPESTTTLVAPEIPNENMYVTYFVVTDGVVETPAPTITGNKSILEREKQPFQVYNTGEINDTYLDDFFYGYLNFRGAVTDLKSCRVYQNTFLYSGKEILVKNSQATDITIFHLNGLGFQFSFPNGENLVLKPNEIIRFSMKITDPSSGVLEYVGRINAVASVAVADVVGLPAALDLKLDVSAYNQHFKGVYLTEAALNAAHPTASVGDYAQVNVVGATDVVNYNWDAEEGDWIVNAVAGSGALNTDELPEGTSQLYFQTARVLATLLTGISFVTGGAIVSTDSVLVAFGKLQKQISDLATLVSGKQDTLVSATNIKTKGGISLLGSGDIPNSAKITTTVSITNATTTTAGDVQEGKIVKIDNGVNVINYTVNGAINASFIKMGTGAITFVQGSGRTLTGANGTLILNGAVNSTASIVSDGTVDTLYINNL